MGKLGIRDITLHEEVISKVMGLEVKSDNAEEANRVARVASWFKWENSKLWLKGDLDREVPPICSRAHIIATAAQQLAYPGGGRLYQLLKPRFYWEGMKLDCIRVCQSL
jgi:hypothetical protein